MEKTLQFKFDVLHLPGKYNAGADATSRNPVGMGETGELDAVEFTGKAALRHSYSQISGDDIAECEELEARVVELSAIEVGQGRGKMVVDWDDVKAETSKCTELQNLRDLLENRMEMGEELQKYKPVLNELKVYDGIIKYREAVVIPESLRAQTLELLHQGHTGVSGMKLRACGMIWWPGLHKDIERTRTECWSCAVNAPSQPAEPPVELPRPEYPMQMIVADYFDLEGYSYLVIVDRYSNWPSVFRIQTKEGSDELCRLMRNHFMMFGKPEELTTDGGPQFTAEKTTKFLESWGVKHRVSSAYFPHANLRAEQGVRTVKRLLRGNVGPGGSLDSDRVARALLNYRNTPDRDLGRSPAQIVFGRSLNDAMPLSLGKLRPSVDWLLSKEQRERALKGRQDRMQVKWAEHSRELKPLREGDRVWVQNQTGIRQNKWDRTGVVQTVMGNRQYRVRLDQTGRETVRNRRFLRPWIRVSERKETENESDRDVRAVERPVRNRRRPVRFCPG